MAPSVGEAFLDVRDLVVRRGENEVLHGVSCALQPGSVTGLMGPSGCGKSTLIRSIVGAQRITSGSITIDGVPAGSPQLRHRVGYTSQGLSIYPDVGVRDNVRYFARLAGASLQRADAIIERVGLADHAGHKVSRLSGGQANRVSLACALVGSPDLLVLDEPTVGLDPLTRESLWELFAELASSGVTLLVSSHVMDEANRCDSVLFMRDGRFLAHESVAALQAQTGTTSPEGAFLALVRESVA
ncbi:MAG: ABC transporter ATP-binding protein [Actinomycetes bacterium]